MVFAMGGTAADESDFKQTIFLEASRIATLGKMAATHGISHSVTLEWATREFKKKEPKGQLRKDHPAMVRTTDTKAFKGPRNRKHLAGMRWRQRGSRFLKWDLLSDSGLGWHRQHAFR